MSLTLPLPTELDYKSAPVLLVDDEATNVLLLQKTLARYGFTNLVSTTDSRQVVDMVVAHNPALILLDINMPHLDGFEVLEQLAKLETHSPSVLMLTAQTSVEHKVRALKAGARDYLSKPFEFPELLARVRNLLEAHLYGQHMVNQKEELEQRVQERTAELNQSRKDIIRRLGRAAEFRDNETGMHIVRMSHYSRILADAFGLDAATSELILLASPMHDIGKIGIPDRILLKPGKLDGEEWTIMMTHAAIGAEVLSGSDTPLLRMAHDIALCHHEKWDGSGYPNKLVGEQIPIAARIVAVADVFDALTSSRPYKTAWPVEKAVALLQDSRGSHFQPELVDLFIENLPKMLEIREIYGEPEHQEGASAA